MFRTISRRRRGLLVIVASAALALTACGGGDDSSADDGAVAALDESEVVAADDIATNAAGTVADDGTGATPAVGSVAEDEAVLRWAQCMRDNGVDVEDPTVDADGNVQLGPPANGADAGSDDFQVAADACSDLLDGTTFGGGGQLDGVQDAFVAFSDCLRDEGLDVGDADFSGGPPGGGAAAGGGQQEGEAAPEEQLELLAEVIPGLDPEDPATGPAVEVCEPVLTESFDAAGVGG